MDIALRGITFETGEIAHYSMTVDVLDQPGSVRNGEGVKINWGVPYEEGSALAHTLPVENAKPVGESALVLTNQRLILKTGSRVAAVKYSREAQVYVYCDGIRLPRTVGHTLLRFRSGSDSTAEIVAELLSALMRPALT